MNNIYKTLSDKLEENEIVFAITVEHVQMIAQSMGKEPLDYMEMDSVQNGIEWGLDFWGDIVRTAIGNLPLRKTDADDQEDEDNE